MKKFILVLIVITLPLILANAKEYSYLDPPTISVMDFEVTVGKKVIREKDKEPIILDQEYLGKLINHTLVTVLIERNASNSTYMEYYRTAVLSLASEEGNMR